MPAIYIGLGSNLEQPQQQLLAALQALYRHPAMSLTDTSSLYGSAPMGPQDQPDYINAVACIETRLTPLELLSELQQIEQEHGRVRKAQRWGARTLDLDILLMGDLQIQTPKLTIPHYGLKEREFVVYPLLELAPELVLPDGQSLMSVRQHCPENGLRVVLSRGRVWQFVSESV